MDSDLAGIVFDVQRYSIHDGPGIRTVVFLKGCPLRCSWCCNPESQRPDPEVEFRERLCVRCGTCLQVCPRGAIGPDLGVEAERKIDRDRCDDCGRCAEACKSGALHVVGESRSVSEVLAEALRDAAYYRRSGGGVTLSGGEPMAQPAFARGLLQALYQQNVHTAVETTGCATWAAYEAVLPFVDLFLYDLKHIDPDAHRRFTGATNSATLTNARRLATSGATIVLRVPLIPEHNLDEGTLAGLADFAAELAVREVHLMPFHHLGKDKYRRLGRHYTLGHLTGLRDHTEGLDRIRRARDIFIHRGLTTLVGG